MNIGFDAKRIFHNQTGLGNYSRDTVRILSDFHKEHNYFLFNPRPHRAGRFFPGQANITEVNPQHPFYKKFPSLWRSSAIVNTLKANHIQLYHGLTNELPLGIHKSGIKTVVSIHDLIFIRFPELYPVVDRNIYRFKFKYACKIADKIIAISQQTKSDIIEYFGVAAEKVAVIYQGCHPIFQKSLPEDELTRIKQQYQLPEKYVLSVGTIEQRKNLLSLVKAIKPLENINLVIVGKKTKYADIVFKYVRDNQMTDRVFHLENVNLQDLAGLYQNAGIFCYPSIFEGFGIPIIEALFSNVPVITSTGSCFSEAGGPHSIYIDPNNVREIREAILSIWDNPEKAAHLAENGWQFAQRFKDDAIATNLMAVYNQLMVQTTN